MKKVIAASIVGVLLIGSSAVAQIDVQYQTWNLALSDSVSLSGDGLISASTIQGVGTVAAQDLTSGVATASQGIGGAVFESGTVTTDGSATSLTQSMTVAAAGLTATLTVPYSTVPGQEQKVEVGGGELYQSEGVAIGSGSPVVAEQTLSKTEADTGATAEGLTLVAFGMGQTAANNANDATQWTVMLGGSYSTMEAEADSLGTVTTNMDASVIQLQQAH